MLVLLSCHVLLTVGLWYSGMLCLAPVSILLQPMNFLLSRRVLHQFVEVEFLRPQVERLHMMVRVGRVESDEQPNQSSHFLHAAKFYDEDKNM